MSISLALLLCQAALRPSAAASEPQVALVVRAAGDFDGDGTLDAVVQADPGDVLQVFRGVPGDGLETTAATVLRPEPCHPGDDYGSGVTVGDFDGDGFDDLAVGARGANAYRGRVDIHHGTAAGLQTQPQLVLQEQKGLPEVWFGGAVGAADIDGDEVDDLVVLLARYGQGEAPSALHVYSGGVGGLGAAPTSIIVADAFSEPTPLHRMIAGCDIEHDGFDDIIVQ